MIDLNKNPPTLRLHWQGMVSVKCDWVDGGNYCHNGGVAYGTSAGSRCPKCNGTGKIEIEVEMDIDVMPQCPEHITPESIKRRVMHDLTCYQNGEKIYGVEEYDKYRVRVKNPTPDARFVDIMVGCKGIGCPIKEECLRYLAERAVWIRGATVGTGGDNAANCKYYLKDKEPSDEHM